MAEKTEIWYLIGGLRVGGTGKTLVQLANNLPPEKYDVRLFTITDDVPLSEEIDPHITFDCLDARGKLDFATAKSFIQAVRRGQPDILQSFLFFDNNLARITGLVSSDTVTISGVRSVPDDRKLYRSLIDDATLPLADHVVSNSKAGAEWVKDRGVSAENVSVIYNGRKISKYAAASAPDSLYRELDIDSGPVIGTVGRLIERKGHYDLLNAWPDVIERYPDATLLIVGDGPEWDGLHQRVKELNCANSVRFAGMRDDVPQLLKMMDIFVFPSHFEGLPGALLEAMAAKRAIITTSVDGNSELVDSESGIFAQPKAPKELSTQLVRLLDSPDTREDISEAAHSRAVEKFSLDSMVTRFNDLYQRLQNEGEAV